MQEMHEGVTQPQIKIVQVATKEVTPAEAHAYQPGMPTPAPVSNDKTVGEMREDEFLELLVKGIIQADRVKTSLDTPAEEEKNLNPVEKVLATVGDVAHGTVDILEGMIRGGVDILTFGKARRK